MRHSCEARSAPSPAEGESRATSPRWGHAGRRRHPYRRPITTQTGDSHGNGASTTLGHRESAFSDVDIQVDSLDVFGNRGLAEFRVAATFTGPFVIDEEVPVEPNGHQLVLGAAVVADFDGDKIKAVRAYFDDASLLEQMLAE